MLVEKLGNNTITLPIDNKDGTFTHYCFVKQEVRQGLFPKILSMLL